MAGIGGSFLWRRFRGGCGGWAGSALRRRASDKGVGTRLRVKLRGLKPSRRGPEYRPQVTALRRGRRVAARPGRRLWPPPQFVNQRPSAQRPRPAPPRPAQPLVPATPLAPAPGSQQSAVNPPSHVLQFAALPRHRSRPSIRPSRSGPALARPIAPRNGMEDQVPHPSHPRPPRQQATRFNSELARCSRPRPRNLPLAAPILACSEQEHPPAWATTRALASLRTAESCIPRTPRHHAPRFNSQPARAQPCSRCNRLPHAPPPARSPAP